MSPECSLVDVLRVSNVFDKDYSRLFIQIHGKRNQDTGLFFIYYKINVNSWSKRIARHKSIYYFR